MSTKKTSKFEKVALTVGLAVPVSLIVYLAFHSGIGAAISFAIWGIGTWLFISFFTE